MSLSLLKELIDNLLTQQEQVSSPMEPPRDPKEIAEDILKFLDKSTYREVLRAIKSGSTPKALDALELPMRTAVNGMDDINWTISLTSAVKMALLKLVVKRLLASDISEER